jgi:hypothetical protein
MTLLLKMCFFIFLSTLVHAEETNYHECLFNKENESQADKVGNSIAIYCTTRFFDTAPTAFQAQVLNQDIEGMKARDPKFKRFYDTVRKNGSNAIYSDKQIILMYIDKREVNKE